MILFNKCHFSAINCTEPPFNVPNNAVGAMNWTEVLGNPRPYSTIIEYSCPVKEWGYPESGFNKTVVTCSSDGVWNVSSVSKCVSKYKGSVLKKPQYILFILSMNKL